VFDKDKKHQLRMDHAVDQEVGRIHQGLMQKHLQELHKKLRTPSFGAKPEHEDMGETPDEEKSEEEQKEGIPEEGEVTPQKHADILKEMFDVGPGEHEEEKGHEMERHAEAEPSKSAIHENHEPVMEEEHDSEPDHMLSAHKKKRPFGGI
jgi:hypothetical protein